MVKTTNPEPAKIDLVFLRYVMAALIGLSMTNQVSADIAGSQLAKRVYERPDGNDVSSVVTMMLTERGHSPRLRKMVLYRMDKKAGEVSTLIRFTEPADIEGTGLLTLDPVAGDSNQWIYLPALERVRRIDSNRKGGRFVNSDYYYEDLRDRKVDKDEHRIIGHESVGGSVCDVLESRPTDARNSVYVKRVSWIDPGTMLPMRIDFYEKREDQPSKRLMVDKRDKLQGYWTVMDSTMTDLNNGHQTRLILERVVYDRGLSSRVFTTRVLEDENAEREFRP